jgi:hypothetical protein
MLILVGAADALEVVLADASVSPLPCIVSYRDIDTDEYLPGRAGVVTNGATDVVLLAGSPSYNRVIDGVSIFNPNLASETVTVKQVIGGTEFIHVQVTLAERERLEYADGAGWRVLTISGAVKTSLNQGTNAVASGDSVVVLPADQTNNNSVANTIQDVTGLSFPVVANQRYSFDFFIRYTVPATTTGSRWSITGPGFSELVYESEYSSGTATRTLNSGLGAYDSPAVANANSALIGSNSAMIWGIVRPSADGSIIARFASEVASSAVIARAGSYVRYRAL